MPSTYLGFPGTTGLETMDYRLTDALAGAVGEDDQWYTERLVRLNGRFLCYGPPGDAPGVGPVPALSAGQITLGSFNNLSKITPELVRLWARVLGAVPGSRMMLKSKAFADQEIQARILGLFQGHGVTSGRSDLVDFVPDTKGHLSVYNQVDIALGTFPYNGTTTVEALWMGVPTVTLLTAVTRLAWVRVL